MSLILPRPGASPLPSILSRPRVGLAAAAAIVRALIHRRQALRVADLPDHLLADMGLRRDDVHAALTSNWRADPTYLLARSAKERHGKR